MEENQGTVLSNTITVNGQEYDATEAQTLLDLGKRTREAEQKYNTTYDRVWPEYGKINQTNKELTQQLQEAKTQLAEFQSKQNKGTDTAADLTEAREAARKLGIVLDEDLGKAGYIKKDDLDSYVESKLTEREQARQTLSIAEDLQKEIDGTDGRPRFNTKAVLAYARAYPVDDPMGTLSMKDILTRAYEDMHSDQIKTWKDQQIQAGKKQGLTTLKTSGKKEPAKITLDDSNVSDALREALGHTE